MKTSLTTRIVGGQDAPSPIPWQAHLHYDSSPVCGATIIDEETVLTTSICVVKSFSNPVELLDKALFQIEAGVVFHGDSNAQTKGVSEIIIHPCYRFAEKTFSAFDNDLAILKLDPPLVFDDKVKPICLPDASFEPGTVKGVVSGWGDTISGTLYLY